MSETVKLIIEIPEDFYEITKAKVAKGMTYALYATSIANGIPLDDVKAELKEWYWQADKQELAKDPCVIDSMIDLFIRTIDNHIEEGDEIK